MRQHLPLSFFLFASLLQSFFYWFLSIIISKTAGLGLLGDFSFVLSILTPLTILASLQLKNYYLTNTDGEIWSKVVRLRLLLPATLYIVFFMIMWISGQDLFHLILPLTLIKGSELWSELCQMRWQKVGNLHKVSTSLSFRYIVLIAVCLTSYFHLIHSSLFWMLALVSLVIAFVDFIASPFPLRANDLLGINKTFKTTLALSLSAVFTACLVNVPRYILKINHTDQTLGLFTALFYFYVIPSIFINFILQGVIHRMQNLLKSGLIEISGAALAVTAVVLFFFLERYAQVLMLKLYSVQEPWLFSYSLLLSALFLIGGLNTILHFTLYSLNIYHIQLKATLIALVVTTSLGTLMIPSDAIIGAFFSFLAGLLLQFLIYTFAYLAKNNE
jgi:hypothetical protein